MRMCHLRYHFIHHPHTNMNHSGNASANSGFGNPMDTMYEVFFIVILMLIAASSILGNMLIIVVVAKKKVTTTSV